jgi:hypothetical protein
VYDNPGGYNLLLTIEKTGAYIEYLYEHALVEIVNAEEVEQGLPAKYRVIGDVLEKVNKEIHRQVDAETSRQVNT